MGMTIGTDYVLLNLDDTQQKFQNTVTQLSSGLRVNNAADDPSGYAIATNLQSKTMGLQQASQNVQNANNALNVAMGALNTVQTILERVNTLVVESNSDINSASDLQNIQDEINQLMDEVNTIGQKTNFNGLNLLNGQFDTSEGSAASLTQVTSPYGGTPTVVNYNGAGQAGPLVTQANIVGGGFFAPSLLVFTVTGYSPNAVDPDSGTPIGPGVYIQFDAYSLNSATENGQPLFQDVSAVAVNGGQTGVIPFTNANGTLLLLDANLSNLTAADVGSSIAFLSTGQVAPSGGTQLSVNDGGDEGTTVGFSLPTVNTNALGLSGISVLAPGTEGIVPGSGATPYDEGTNASNNLSASYAEIQVGNALTKITSAQAAIGAQVVSLNVDNQNDNVAANELTASASNITDLNVGQATTQFTQEQILVDVGTSVLAAMNSDAKQNTALLIQALVA